MQIIAAAPAAATETWAHTPPGTVRIPLNHGLFALVDAADAPRVAPYLWYANYHDGRWRAGHGERITVNGQSFVRMRWMHRLLLDVPTGVHVAHLNGNGLDNRRGNLRVSTPREDGARRRKNRNNHSGYRGVSWHAQTGTWQAGIVARPRRMHLGYYPSAEEAARAYDVAARELFGVAAYQNFPTSSGDPAHEYRGGGRRIG